MNICQFGKIIKIRCYFGIIKIFNFKLIEIQKTTIPKLQTKKYHSLPITLNSLKNYHLTQPQRIKSKRTFRKCHKLTLKSKNYLRKSLFHNKTSTLIDLLLKVEPS